MNLYRNKNSGKFESKVKVQRSKKRAVKKIVKKVKSTIKTVLIILALSFVTSFFIGTETVYTSTKIAKLEAVDIDKVEIVLEHYIDKLANCESGGIQEGKRDSIVILDTNDWNSRGRLQFQYPTVMYYLEKFEMLDPALDKSDIINLMHTKEFSYMLAREILIRDGAWSNWYTCGQRTGLDDFVENYL